VKSETLIKLLGADRLDNNNKAHSNGYFDYVEGYTVSDGRVFFPAAEPFGSYLYKTLVGKGVPADKAAKYSFHGTLRLHEDHGQADCRERQISSWSASSRALQANVISLGAANVPQGSVVVTAGGVKLTEGSDYVVDYSAGEVTILNQSIIDAGTTVNVSLESERLSAERKTMFGMNWEYDFSKNFQISRYPQHL
jgi:cell surface protein SprA